MKKPLLLIIVLFSFLSSFSQVKAYRVWSTNILEADNYFVWQGDTIRKDSIVYVDNKIDSIRVKYINGAWSEWFKNGISVEVDGDPENEIQAPTLVGNTLGATGTSTVVDLSVFAPVSGSGNYIWNGTDQQTGNFNLSGVGRFSGSATFSETSRGISFFNDSYKIAFDGVGATRGYIRFNVDTYNSPIHGWVFSGGTAGSQTDVALLTSVGNLGLGYSTIPTARLSLGSSLGVSNDYIHVYQSGNVKYGFGLYYSEFRQYFPSDAHLSLGIIDVTDGATFSEKVRIENTGNVGIGYSSGTEITNNKLAVNGSGYFNTNLTVNGLSGTGTRLTTADANGTLSTTTSISINENNIAVTGTVTATNLSGTNTGDSATNTTSNSYADAKVTQTITDGVTATAPSEDAVYDALAGKEPSLTKGTFTEEADGLVLSDSTRQVIGGATVLGLKAGRVIPTTANISHGETAFDDKINSLAFTGTTTKTLTLTQQDGGTLTATFVDNSGEGSFVYPDAGIAVSNGATWSPSITNTTVGTNFLTLANPSAITFPRINANNTVSALSANDFITAIGALSEWYFTTQGGASLNGVNNVNGIVDFVGAGGISIGVTGTGSEETPYILTFTGSPYSEGEGIDITSSTISMDINTLTANLTPAGEDYIPYYHSGANRKAPLSYIGDLPIYNANKLQDIPISETDPINGQLLGYNGSTWTPTASGSGTVTSFSAGDLSPLFTTSEANPTTTPALSFSLSNAGAYTVLGNQTGSATVPSYGKLDISTIYATGTPSSSTVLFGDGRWDTPTGGTNYWQAITGGIAPATITDEVRIGATTDMGNYKLQVEGNSRVNGQHSVYYTGGDAAYASSIHSNASIAAGYFGNTGTGNGIFSHASGGGIGGLFETTGSTTNSSLASLVSRSTTSGTPAAGLGTHISYEIENSANEDIEFGTFGVVSTDVTNGSEDGQLEWYLIKNGTITSTMTLTNDGDLYAHNFIGSSDRRLKRNIKPISNKTLKNVGKIKFIQFISKGDSSNRVRYGVIAQQAEQHVPELVYTGNNGMKAVGYTDLTIAKLAEMEKRLNDLETQVKYLTKKLRRYEK
jgi:hypothetical protein